MRCPSEASRSSARVGSSAVERKRAHACDRHARRPRQAAGRGGVQDRLDREPGLAVDLVDDPAVAEHQGAVADVGDLLEIGGDHQDGESTLRGRR